MLVYAHGLNGSPWGDKIAALRDAGFEVKAPDCRGRTLAQRIDALDEATRLHPGLLVGSSYGGLAALVLALRRPERIHRLVLFAPALHLYEPPVEDPNGLVLSSRARAIIVHGRADEVVPIDVSRRFQARSGKHVALWEVEDDHRLAASTHYLVAAVRELSAS